MPGLNEYMIARTVYFDELFKEALKQKLPQIVLLGAGYDSRANRFESLNQGTRIFELDSLPTQNRKKACLKKGKIPLSKKVAFVSIDFNRDSLADILEKAGFKRDQRTLFIWEGVTYYLEIESVDETLAFVSQESHHESTIAFDYTISISDENVNDFYGVKEFKQTMREHHAPEALMFAIDEGEIDSFLDQRGLKLVDHFDNEQIERTFLHDDDGSLLGQITGHFRLAAASPKSNQYKPETV